MHAKHLFFALFILLSIIDVSMIYFDFKEFLWLPRGLSLTAIVLHGYFSTKQVHTSFWLLSFFIVLTGVLFSLNAYTLIGMCSLLGLRLAWLKLLLDTNTKIDREIFLKVFSITTMFFGVVLYLLYVDTIFYYLSIGTTLSLIALLAVSFSLFTKKGGAFGNREMLFSIIIFIISDALSGSKKITGTSMFFIILSVVLYNTAYYFLMKAVMKNAKK
ncbi:hypothetical protein [uncultured Tenacibaculum sp.]|uniref:hypothetical protein n=1 Tax=uncultured Tenacibaculum sp. TaxID=174713 RepID=UPI00261D4720|nr:hypothetical protein [uncultured Tenacibaculum sp.]